jgi:hypothetical protein
MNNFYKPTPVKWRKLGDTILLGCTSFSGLLMTAPLSDNHKAWAILGLNAIGVLGKMITNFFKED